MTSSQSPAPSLATQSSPASRPGPSIMNPDQNTPHFTAEKRKMEPELGDSGYLNNPSKIPKMEPKTPGSPGLNPINPGRGAMGSESLNMMGAGAMSGGSVKVEVKSEAEDGDLTSGKMQFSGSGSGSLNKSNPEDNFLLDNSVSLTTEQPQLTPVDQKDKQQKTNTAAKIRTALEASGLAGNLTPEDLQTLKRLNEIAKSTGLSQEQKSAEASQLLKNNPNVSRLLLKLRTGKNMNQAPKEGGMIGVSGGPAQAGYPGPGQPHNGQFPGPQAGLAGLAGPGGRASPSTGPGLSYNSNYGQHQPGPGQNNNNYYTGHTGHTGHHPPPGAGQWNGGPAPGPGPGSPGYYRPEMAGHMAQRMHPDMVPANFPGMGVRAGPGSNMYGMGMMERMHGMGSAPRTMYVNRQTMQLMQPDYPATGGGPGHGMMGPRPGFPGSVPPPYMSPGHTGYHPGPPRQMMTQRMPGVSPMMSHPGHHPGPGQYEMGPGQRANSGMYSEYGDNFGSAAPIPGNNFAGDFRENMLSSKFPGSDYSARPGSSQMAGQPVVSQLRQRLSQPGPASLGATSAAGAGSELANRLLHGKPQTEPPPSYAEYNNINNQQNGNNQLRTGSEALFDEIDNSQFDYVPSLDTNESQNTQTFNLENNESTNDESSFDSWKMTANTSEVRNTMLRKLSTAIESNQHISPGEASKIAHDIETKAFGVSRGETEYKMGIAHHLAQIFSQFKAGPDSGSPDSTTWQEQAPGQPAHSSPDSSQTKTEGAHFPSDTTLNCFQVK